MLLTRIFKNFIKVEKTGSLLLVAAFITSFVIANSNFAGKFNQILEFHFFHLSVKDWINEGLMTLFFLQVGLEIKRELVEGELKDLKVAGLPIFGAIGGMLVPALIYYTFTFNTHYTKGFGIPMATDIALSLAIISLMGNKIPASLKLFLAALAIIDDLGAIVIIAIFYTNQFQLTYLVILFLLLIIIAIISYKKVTYIPIYILFLIVLWIILYNAGFHPSIAGAIIAISIPFKEFNNEERVLFPMHKFVTYGIVPIFILVNALIDVRNVIFDNFLNNYTLGIFFGLTLGKPLGILLFCWLSIKLKFAKLALELNYRLLLGAGIFAGIGFTMSIFVALLSFSKTDELNQAKLIITIAGFTSAIGGIIYFKLVPNKIDKLKTI
ncbi:MAG: Na+/H+ antiporter NhaA [Bacteroidota bacterium]